MTSPADTDSFSSEDGRIEVVFDLEGVSESRIALIIKAALATLDAEQVVGADRITVLVTGDDRIRELNREFKGEDEVTDVLSFNMEGDEVVGGEEYGDDLDGVGWPAFAQDDESDSGESERLGDIAISLPQVERQAAENSISADRELAMLTIHGVLHLLGYDHADLDEEKVMFGKTDQILTVVIGA
ncbi:MAG: rRNA maturation RNase YbeY [Chloroflexi bacterium]|nr:rRNA maturation RNase YbeY [Chloroflexota bacterium]